MRTALLTLSIAIASTSGSESCRSDFAAPCYLESLPDIPPATTANRTIPWGVPSTLNGTQTCCSSLDEIRAGIDAIDSQLLTLLSQRSAYVREATRFKATRDTVDVPSRDAEVVQTAVDSAAAVGLPQTIAKVVFEAILNSSVQFEYCVFDEFLVQSSS